MLRGIGSCRTFAGEMMGYGANASEACAGLLKHVIKPTYILKVLEDPLNRSIMETLRKRFFIELKNIVSPQDVLDTLDAAGISRNGYDALYRLLTLATRKKGILRPLLPTPYSVTMAKQCENAKVSTMLGGYKCVQDSMAISPTKSFQYNAFNNVFIDLITLQQAMIKYYGLTWDECKGNVVFVLKLDECQVVKGRKLERVSLTLMNRALRGQECTQEVEHNPEEVNQEEQVRDSNGDETNEPQEAERSTIDNRARTKKIVKEYYGVQSEKNIWWLAAFELPHETHKILRWYFSRTCIPSVISDQSNGGTLEVNGVGRFHVEWHLAGDLKTLKCMLGCQQGANSRFPCIYCCHTRVDPSKKSTKEKSKKSAQKILTMSRKLGKQCNVQASGSTTTATKSETQWVNGIKSCDQQIPPNRDQVDIEWNPILDIPLARVHVCTLHARLRILDKLLKLHVNYAWNMEPMERRVECVERLEEVLSSVGLHGGAVSLSKDGKVSGATQNNPSKICMGGSKARHLLSNHAGSNSQIEFELWKKVCDCTTYRGNAATMGLKRAKVWATLDELVRLLEKAKLSQEEISSLKTLIGTFTDQMVDAWGETHITHYMVRNLNHLNS